MAGERWWQRGAIYQIYPRSFADGDGDGIGDLRGLLSRIGYLEALGIDAVWLSPIYPSPMADFGYDVSNFTDVDPIFGTLAGLDALVAALHARGIKLVLDFVPNHSSDRHPWFLASRASRDDPRRDWYLWRDPGPDGTPPNNWIAQFGGSAWTFDAPTGQFYLHSFLPQQPDLNWRNPAVRTVMYDVLRFWLARGIDGFRIDAFWLVIKDDRFRDDPPDPSYEPGDPEYHRLIPVYNADRPEVHDVAAEMRAVSDRFDDRVLIGEVHLPIERLVTYYGRDLDGTQLPFNFHLLDAPWTAAGIADVIERYEAALPRGAWPNWVLGNHDTSRIASRVGLAQARVAAMLLLTLRGTPTLYNGDELGMADVAIPPGRVRDPAELRQPNAGLGRDPERTPIPWDATPKGGFTTGEPWLPLGPHETANVSALERDPRSILALYRALLALRRREPALSVGSIETIAAHGDVLVYERHDGDRRIGVALNFGPAPADVACTRGRVVLSTELDRSGERILASFALRANEGVVFVAGDDPAGGISEAR